MKLIKTLLGTALVSATLGTAAVLAADKPAETKVTPYPLNTCLVSGEKLGQMGAPYVITNGTREIKFCCSGCVKDFNKDSAKYLKKLDAAEKKAK
jgi:hypothetical protein